MHTKRIIPCLDVKDGKVVKGVNFVSLQDVGDPVSLAKYYDEQGADELVFLDISATQEGRSTMLQVVEQVASQLFIPFTVGGGIRTLEDIKRMLRAGADKVSLNSAAIKDPDLIRKGAQMFGSQCIVVAIDAKRRKEKDGWNVVIHGGQLDTEIDVLDWVRTVSALGAGELLLTSMDADGTKQGFDLPLCKAVNEIVDIPVIASGGARALAHFYDVFAQSDVDAALAASLFHYGEIAIDELKCYLSMRGIAMRILPDVRNEAQMISCIDFDKQNGLVPAIVQDVHTKQVLMLAYMSKQSLHITLTQGYACYYSRSRKALWLKGETSGHVQKVVEIRCDCDHDTLLLLVEQSGAACHTGAVSCFYHRLKKG